MHEPPNPSFKRTSGGAAYLKLWCHGPRLRALGRVAAHVIRLAAGQEFSSQPHLAVRALSCDG
jgi:hypothetical protein